MKLHEVAAGQLLLGVEPSFPVKVKLAEPSGNAVTLFYLKPDGSPGHVLLTEEQLASVTPAPRMWSFEGEGDAFRLTIEARRMQLGFLFDPMMAVHASNVQALPHQITAVYESMLPRQPLRFLLADDPGAGKTVMAGLYIRELLLRADSKRILIVSPGSLVTQWAAELHEKFNLRFAVYSPQIESANVGVNYFNDVDQLIVRLDQISRSEELLAKLIAAKWDLVIFDEAHKLSAHYQGNEVKYTKRFSMAQQLGAATRHLLLMTATPHNGHEEDYQLFLSLLDRDRFYGKFRGGETSRTDAADLMRRMVKEELIKFDGTPLFPERRAYTANYQLAPIEADLYERVTSYVRDQMGMAEQLADGKRRGAVGFALTLLQRRLASSPAAIFESLTRRRKRLQERLAELKSGGKRAVETVFGLPDDEDDLDAAEQEALEETILDDASAAQTAGQLEAEVLTLQALVQQAQKVVTSKQDKKWDELSRILQHDPNIAAADGKRRKVIIFTEHRDTLNYLFKRISDVDGNSSGIVTIHGGTSREDRLDAQARFRSDPTVRTLIATDAAGEGVNLQTANLMFNYDLPWNPNRLEQRFGRIHRIGQTEVCHLWSLVAKDTREGEVYFKLLQKLENEKKALDGRVFNILGEVFEGESLRELLIRAIQYGEQPEVKAKLFQKVESAFDPSHIKNILDRNALAEETMTKDRLYQVKEELEAANARKLQPYFVRSFFSEAFSKAGGTMAGAERDRYSIKRVPQTLRDGYKRRLLEDTTARDATPVLERYDRVCFMQEAIRPADKPGLAQAELLHPGHPLVRAVCGELLEKNAALLKQGAVLVDLADEGTEPHLLFALTHAIRDGAQRTVSQRMQFVRVSPEGHPTFAGYAPHLDLEALKPGDFALLQMTLNAVWLQGDLDGQALKLANESLASAHFKEVRERHGARLKKMREAVHQRLTQEINFQTERWEYFKDKGDLPNVEKTRLAVAELQSRLDARTAELKQQEQLLQQPPVVLAGALVVPIGLLKQLRGEKADTFSKDPEARKRIETLAMEAVRKTEEARGWKVTDVSAAKCGWDLTSTSPDGAQRRLLEVKGRFFGAPNVTVTRNEVITAFNAPDDFELVVVLVREDDSVDGPHYIKQPFKKEPDWHASAVTYELDKLLKLAKR